MSHQCEREIPWHGIVEGRVCYSFLLLYVLLVNVASHVRPYRNMGNGKSTGVTCYDLYSLRDPTCCCACWGNMRNGLGNSRAMVRKRDSYSGIF